MKYRPRRLDTSNIFHWRGGSHFILLENQFVTRMTNLLRKFKHIGCSVVLLWSIYARVRAAWCVRSITLVMEVWTVNSLPLFISRAQSFVALRTSLLWNLRCPFHVVDANQHTQIAKIS